MFDIGFVELLICGVIALLVLGPERLPTAARAAGRWIGGARRMVNQFTSELDRQLKAEELREELRKAGDVGLEDVEKTVRGALDEAKKYEHMILPENRVDKPRPAPATRRTADTRPTAEPAQQPQQMPEPTPATEPTTSERHPEPHPDQESASDKRS
ncbi:twin-arginine translocation protein subunit TatB [Marinobacter lipolyticus SM19]|uniref:Sec-independent protein translocase protein TatB n=1 Tax=Marinobacter lipolyticus SM19 TaxID=1318628 RepID=R8B491_9GAMM|nr:Sec-independent protein translocase protein TatB [Marinobacter lipolyticus]EON93339.1 twin-arginine translocation protein subunit TatB [Marinobacter lipolyticus SM19]